MSQPSQSVTIPIKGRDWWRERAQDLTFFNSQIMPHAWDDKFHDFGVIHSMMCQHLDPFYQKNQQIYLSAHRGSGKTTQLLGFECWWLTWGIVKKMADSMIYNTATKENCWNMSADVKHTFLQNDFLHWVFPEIPSRENEWDDMTKNRIKCRHMKLDFASLETTLVSRHYPNWLNDDLENDQNARSDYSRLELIRTWKYQKAILTKIKKRAIGREIEVGTPYHVNGLTWKIRNMPYYSRVEIPCYKNRDKNQGVWYDELYDVSDFEEKRDKMGSSIFCTPEETPIIMADWSVKKISEIQPGDEVVGFKFGDGKRTHYVKTKVLRVHKGRDYVYSVDMESGRTVKCTKDHYWYSGRLEEQKTSRSSYHKIYKKIRENTNLISELDPAEERDPEKLKAWAYLGGIVDGEGACKHSGIFISQSPSANPEVWKKIKDTLDFLGISYKIHDRPRHGSHPAPDGHLIDSTESSSFYLRGGRELYFSLMRYSSLGKKNQLVDKIYRHPTLTTKKDKTIKLERGLWRDVYGLETETGNYIAWGYLSSNSAQYLLQPLSEEDALCPEAWLKYWDALPDVRWRTMVVDPGGAEPGVSDATGITICDTDEFGNIYVVYGQEFFLTPMKFCDLVVKLKEEYDVDDCRVEKEKYSITVADLFRHRYPGFNISFVEHKGRAKGSRDKQINTRIWRLKQWFESKRIFVGKNQREFIDQLLTFPQTSTGRDDMIDSLAYHLDIRRVPKRKSKLILPSGREWVPSIEESFEREMDQVLAKARGNREGIDNDSLY